jgi:hypothetical protein
VVSNTYCVVFLFCFSSSCCQFLWIVLRAEGFLYSYICEHLSQNCIYLSASFIIYKYLTQTYNFSAKLSVVLILILLLPISLDCPFLIAPLVFSIVYLRNHRSFKYELCTSISQFSYQNPVFVDNNTTAHFKCFALIISSI